MHTSRAHRIWLLVLLGSFTMFGALSIDMYLPAFPDVAADFGVRTADIQLTLTSFMLGMGAGQVLYGPLSDRFGRKRPLLLGVALFIMASIACSLVSALPVLVVWRFIQGLSASAGIVIARAFVRDHYTGIDLARTMTALGVVFALAPALAPTVGAFILSFADWHWVFITLAAFGAYAFVGALTLKESHPKHRRTEHGIVDAVRAYGEIFQHRQFRFAALSVVGSSVALFGFVSSSPSVFIDQYEMSQRVFAIVFGLNSLAMVLGSQINIRILPRLGVRGVSLYSTALGVTAATAMVIVAALELPLGALLASAAVVTASVSVMFGNGMTLALIPFGHRAGSATALLGLLQTIGAAISSAVLSVLDGSATVHMAGAMLVGTTLSFFFVRRTSEPQLTH